MSKTATFITENFADKNIARALTDYVMVLDAFEKVLNGSPVSEDQTKEALVTALFGGMNNAFHAFIAPYARVIITETIRTSKKELSIQFLERIGPQIKTLLNDETPRDFFEQATSIRRKLS